MPDEPKSYSTGQAHSLIERTMNTRISRSTIYRLMNDGRLFAQRIGSRVVIPKDALFDFLERCKRGERY